MKSLQPRWGCMVCKMGLFCLGLNGHGFPAPTWFLGTLRTLGWTSGHHCFSSAPRVVTWWWREGTQLSLLNLLAGHLTHTHIFWRMSLHFPRLAIICAHQYTLLSSLAMPHIFPDDVCRDCKGFGIWNHVSGFRNPKPRTDSGLMWCC